MSNAPRSERWAFFDCFAGLSGDMTLGALIDLGLPVSDLEELMNLLGLAEVRLAAAAAHQGPSHRGAALEWISASAAPNPPGATGKSTT